MVVIQGLNSDKHVSSTLLMAQGVRGSFLGTLRGSVMVEEMSVPSAALLLCKGHIPGLVLISCPCPNVHWQAIVLK